MSRRKRKNIKFTALHQLLGSFTYFWVFQVEDIAPKGHQFEFGFLIGIIDNVPLYLLFLISQIKNISYAQRLRLFSVLTEDAGGVPSIPHQVVCNYI